jgi:hypothetical protein
MGVEVLDSVPRPRVVRSFPGHARHGGALTGLGNNLAG